MKEIIEKLAKFENLSGVEMTDVIERIVTGRVTEAQIASLLLALKMKGETPEERTAIAQVMRGHAQHIPTEIHDSWNSQLQTSWHNVFHGWVHVFGKEKDDPCLVKYLTQL